MRVGGWERKREKGGVRTRHDSAFLKSFRSEGRAERERKRTDREYSGVYSASTDSY